MSLLRLTLFSSLLFFQLAACSATSPQNIQPPLTVGTEQQPLQLSGNLAQDLHIGGVIRISGDLLIPENRSLYISAGSKVYILGNDSTKINPEFLDKGTEILVKGSLFVSGTADAPVSFSLDDETPEGENWAGIELEQAEGAIFTHVDILGAETGILSNASSLQLEQVNILGSRYGLVMQGAGHLRYVGGRISGGDAGILCFDHAALALKDLKIVDNAEEGLYLNRNCTLEAESLQISRNDLGVVASSVVHQQLSSQLSNNRLDFKPLPEGSEK